LLGEEGGLLGDEGSAARVCAATASLTLD
jgi:hypothetical protein